MADMNGRLADQEIISFFSELRLNPFINTFLMFSEERNLITITERLILEEFNLTPLYWKILL